MWWDRCWVERELNDQHTSLLHDPPLILPTQQHQRQRRVKKMTSRNICISHVVMTQPAKRCADSGAIIIPTLSFVQQLLLVLPDGHVTLSPPHRIPPHSPDTKILFQMHLDRRLQDWTARCYVTCTLWPMTFVILTHERFSMQWQRSRDLMTGIAIMSCTGIIITNNRQLQHHCRQACRKHHECSLRNDFLLRH